MNTSFTKCRLCLKLGSFSSVFEKDDSMKLSEMVMAFSKVQIFEGDGLTDRVCGTCIEKLSTTYLFKLQCEKTDKILRSNIDLPLNGDNITRSVISHVDTSDETDSDMDSIKCVYCSNSYKSVGGHRCQVNCTIENKVGSTGSDETLVATDLDVDFFSADSTLEMSSQEVSCVLCEDKYDKFDSYVKHLDECTANVKLRYFVCSLCHEIHSQKDNYLLHLNTAHFKENLNVKTEVVDRDVVDCVTSEVQLKSVCRKIGWSTEDIYQEIDPFEDKITTQTPTSSPIKSFFSKLSNESFSTPRKVSFRKLIEDGKAKTSNYIPFKRYIKNYKLKKKEALYSPVTPKSQRLAQIQITEPITDSDYGTPSSTSDDSWKMKQNLICACDKKIFMLSENLENRQRVISMITELGGVVAENTKMEMLATHYIAVLPADAYTGMMVCALGTGKWMLHCNYVYDSHRGRAFLSETLYEWMKQPKLLDLDNTSVELAKSSAFWHHRLSLHNSKMPFEGNQVVLIMKKKYRQYYQMVFKTLKAKAIAYDPRTPGSCCSANYCFVDMRVIDRVKLQFFTDHNIPVFPYQYILIYLMNRGHVQDEHKYLIQDCNRDIDTVDFLNNTF